MTPRPGPPTVERDPEFHPSRVEPGWSEPYAPSPELYLRLFANPLLAVAALLFWLALVRWAIGEVELVRGPWAPIRLAALFGPLLLWPRLFQYHCLDCGGTGRLTRWRRHVCPPSAERYQRGLPRRFRGPTPPTQLLWWLWLTLAGLALVAARFGRLWPGP